MREGDRARTHLMPERLDNNTLGEVLALPIACAALTRRVRRPLSAAVSGLPWLKPPPQPSPSVLREGKEGASVARIPRRWPHPGVALRDSNQHAASGNFNDGVNTQSERSLQIGAHPSTEVLFRPCFQAEGRKRTTSPRSHERSEARRAAEAMSMTRAVKSHSD